MPGRVIWCLGMYASASTWMLNAVRGIQMASGHANVGVHFVGDKLDLGLLDQQTRVSLVKSHEVRNEATLLALAGRADIILMTVRDPRDAVASVMEYQKCDFASALKLVKESSALCLDYMKDRRTTCFAYETRFFDDPATMHTLARITGCAISEQAAQECCNRLSRASVEKLIAQLPAQKGVLQDRISGDFLDPQTQWHTHHAGRTGEIGRWRHKLSEPQAQEVETLCEAHRMHRAQWKGLCS